MATEAKTEKLAMDPEKQKEQFSNAYARAVAAAAGCSTSTSDLDDKGVDIKIEGYECPEGYDCVQGDFPSVDLQLKSTFQDLLIKEGNIHYPLKVENYKKLRARRATPIYLVLMLVPRDSSEWLSQSPEELIMRRCSYWLSLAEAPETNNEKNITVQIPVGNLFNVEALLALLYGEKGERA
jgi:hypothetical protein